MRQTKTSKDNETKRCSSCGAKTWLWDAMMLKLQGPWHFQDCPSVPGGAELSVANIEERERWLEEKTVPRKQGARILKAIELMMYSPGDKILYQRRAAILDEIGKL